MLIRYCDICGQEIENQYWHMTFYNNFGGYNDSHKNKDVCKECAELLQDVVYDPTPYKNLFNERMCENKV